MSRSGYGWCRVHSLCSCEGIELVYWVFVNCVIGIGWQPLRQRQGIQRLEATADIGTGAGIGKGQPAQFGGGDQRAEPAGGIEAGGNEAAGGERDGLGGQQIGRASCRESVWQYV